MGLRLKAQSLVDVAGGALAQQDAHVNGDPLIDLLEVGSLHRQININNIIL